MSWGAHLDWGTDALLPAARKRLGVLKHLGRVLPRKSRRLLADGLVVSKTRYLVAVWGGTLDKLLRSVQTLLNDAARFVLQRKGRRDSTAELMAECGWWSAREMVIYHSLLLMWRVLRCGSLKSLADKLWQDEEGIVWTNSPRLLHTTSVWRWRTMAIWNGLSTELRDNTSLKGFKSGMKNWLREQRELQPDPGDNGDLL